MKRKLCDFCQKRSGSKRHREEESTQQHTKERDHIIQIWSAISGDLEHFVSIPTGKSLHTIADLRRAANESGGGYIDPDDDLICGIEIVDNEREISKLDKCTDVDYSTGERCTALHRVKTGKLVEKCLLHCLPSSALNNQIAINYTSLIRSCKNAGRIYCRNIPDPLPKYVGFVITPLYERDLKTDRLNEVCTVMLALSINDQRFLQWLLVGVYNGENHRIVPWSNIGIRNEETEVNPERFLVNKVPLERLEGRSLHTPVLQISKKFVRTLSDAVAMMQEALSHASDSFLVWPMQENECVNYIEHFDIHFSLVVRMLIVLGGID